MRVSVIIPAYNAEKSLGLCLDSLTAQTYSREHYEIIVVDDGSTDGTGQIARRAGVGCLHQQNQGPATARNIGAAAATGDIILFTDSDCIPTPHWIEEMVSSFEDSEIAAVKGAYRTNQKEIVARFAQIEFEERFAILEKAGYTDMVDTYSAGYRRAIFEKLGGFDTRFPKADNEDTELSYRMAERNLKMIFNPRAIVYHLGHPSSLQRYARLKFSRGYWRMVVYKKFPDKMIKDTYTPKSLKLQIVSFFLMLAGLVGFVLPGTVGSLGGVLFFTALAAFICFISPFTGRALKKDWLVGLCTPFLLCLRAAALGAGAIWGKFFGTLG